MTAIPRRLRLPRRLRRTRLMFSRLLRASDRAWPSRSGRPGATDDAGVIAIVVALSMSTFLLGFAALAVDMGSAYTRKAELASVADRLALAGAAGLPDIGTPEGALDQINRTLEQICADEDTPGVCTGQTAPPIAWADDGNPDNGEVSFFADQDGDGAYVPSEQVSATATDATALRVDLAPSVVEFGLAAAFGRNSATLHGTASSRVGTPIGSGILPFALTPDDLDRGEFCVRDPSIPGLAPPPAPAGTVTLDLQNVPDGGVVYRHESDTPLVVELTVPDPGPAGLQNVQFHLSNTTAEVTYTEPPAGFVNTPTRTYYEVTLPTGRPVTRGTIWATGSQQVDPTDRAPFITSTVSATDPDTAAVTDAVIPYTGLPAGTDELCSQPAADRGFVRLSRDTGGSVTQQLAANIRSSPTVRLYPADGLLGAIGDSVSCASTRLSAATSCLATVRGRSFRRALTSGLLTSSAGVPGRLIGNCGNGVRPSHGRSGVDDSKLFTDAGFISTAGHPAAQVLKDRITGNTGSTAAEPVDEGWITSKVLRCPRLAVMPVIDPLSVIGTVNGQTISSFRYVWIDNEDDNVQRGLNGNDAAVTSMRGYVIDPGYLPPVVSGSGRVGPFLGPDMPKEALLIADFRN
jgi:Flp pilus assembly protein TadG